MTSTVKRSTFWIFAAVLAFGLIAPSVTYAQSEGDAVFDADPALIAPSVTYAQSEVYGVTRSHRKVRRGDFKRFALRNETIERLTLAPSITPAEYKRYRALLGRALARYKRDLRRDLRRHKLSRREYRSALRRANAEYRKLLRDARRKIHGPPVADQAPPPTPGAAPVLVPGAVIGGIIGVGELSDDDESRPASP